MGRLMTVPERVASIKNRTRLDGQCWTYLGAKNEFGYAQTYYRGQRWMVHRLMYSLLVGPIPTGADLCHTCDNPACVNPDHLWPGTRQENMIDCVEKGRHRSSAKTHCMRGHEFTQDNTYVTKRGKRQCLACTRRRFRILAGWPEDLADSLERTAKGQRPVGGHFSRERKGTSRFKTHCKRGHSMAGENLYVSPRGRRKCRACHFINRDIRMGRHT